MKKPLLTLSAAAATALTNAPAQAQVATSGYSLPLALAMEAAAEAVRVCEGNGYAVSASIVEPSGLIKVQAKGDHSTVHTRDSSFRKAYTVVTLGPIFRFDTTSAFAELASKNPAGPALSSLPDILPLAGGVAIKAGNEIVAAIGVGGAPGGDKDEVCAHAGAAKIQARVTAAQKRPA
uniref:GlcG/HbpS family heme-binding protein n=1 Tax=uncultured Sphingomonas sp. TaxID=158754 RepID=UPI0025D29E7F|nr:heme-binding protein [uncultured Sphingomonas sp.]